MCPNTKIPHLLHKSAPPVANEVVSPLTPKRAFKLTSNYEGLSIERAKKKPSRSSQNFLEILEFLRIKFSKISNCLYNLCQL